MYDASAGWSELDDALAGSFSGVRIVANKADLPHRECPGEAGRNQRRRIEPSRGHARP